MTEMIESLIRDYGTIVIFIGCLAEGESVALAGGFFAHQHVLAYVPTFIAALTGAFLGDTALFLLGRRFSNRPFVQRLAQRRGFSHALGLARKRPATFVFMNRYAYGMRAVGGVAAGLADIGWSTFLVANLASSLVWATLFVSAGAIFGVGAEAVIGAELHRHERLLVGLAIIVIALIVAAIVARRNRAVAQAA